MTPGQTGRKEGGYSLLGENLGNQVQTTAGGLLLGFLCSQDQKSNLDWPEQGGKAAGAAPRVGRGQNYQLQGPRLRPALHQSLFSAFVWFSGHVGLHLSSGSRPFAF